MNNQYLRKAIGILGAKMPSEISSFAPSGACWTSSRDLHGDPEEDVRGDAGDARRKGELAGLFVGKRPDDEIARCDAVTSAEQP